MEKDGVETQLNAVDPLNLAGILTPGPRIPAVHTAQVLYRDGLPSSMPNGALPPATPYRNGEREIEGAAAVAARLARRR